MFVKDRNFKIKLNLNHICIPYVDNKTSDNLFQDGRIFGLIAENIIANFFGLDKMYGCNDYDLKSNEGLKYEVKTLTKQGLKTCPSYMIGKGREYNIEEHKKYLKKNYIDSLILFLINDFLLFLMKMKEKQEYKDEFNTLYSKEYMKSFF